MTINEKKANRSIPNLILLLAGLIIIVRLISVAAMGLMPQDAYYDFYAQHLALSYFDHPPMIAYLLRIFTGIFGKHVIAIKLADTTVTLCMLVAFYHLTRKFLDRRRALTALIILGSTFMVSILSLISTPDVPLMLCWTITLSFLYEAIFNRKNIYWLWAGISTGLSFDSKYTAVFLLIGVFAFLIFSRSYRRLLVSPWFFIYLMAFAITSLPVVIWNVGNGFASFKFQSQGRVHEGLQIDPLGFLGVIGHQSAILLPILFFSLCYFLFRLIKKYKLALYKMPAVNFFLICFFIPLFLGFFAISFVYWVKLNWMMPAYLTGIIWVGRYWNLKWLKYQLIFSAIVHVALFLDLLFYIVPLQSDDTWFGWGQLAGKVEEIRKEYPKAFIFSADDYKTSSILNFYMNEMVYSRNVVGERALQYDFIGTDLKELNGRDAIYIDSNPWFDNLENENAKLPPAYKTYFTEIIPLQPILIKKGDKVERKFSVFLCRNYHNR